MAALSGPAQNDTGLRLVRDIWGVTAIAILATILRVVAKLRIRQFKVDDVCMIAAQLLGLAGSIVLTVGVDQGLGQHVWDMAESNVPKVIMFDYITQALGLSASCMGRVAFTIYILHLLGSERSHKIILWTLVATQLATNVVSILIMFLQCPGHGSAIWDRPGKAKCWGIQVQAYYGYFQGAFNAATDLYLAVFPTYIFWSLNMKIRAKAGLMVLLGLGLFAMVAAIVKTIQLRVLANPDDDPTAATATMDRWLYIETYLVITTPSIPCIRSLLARRKRRNQNDLSNTYELSSRSRHAEESGTSKGKRRVSRVTGKYLNHFTDDTGSEDDILRSSLHESQCGVDSGIVKRVDITVYVEDGEKEAGDMPEYHKPG